MTDYKGENKVVYIAYFERIPHSVITVDPEKGKFWSCDTWDFFTDALSGNLKGHNSGGMGSNLEIEIPNFCEKSKWHIWADKSVKLLGNTEGVKILKHPILLSDNYTKSRNPFVISEEAYSENYCKVCDGYTDGHCEKHIYED
jgi:hypothetical protein